MQPVEYSTKVDAGSNSNASATARAPSKRAKMKLKLESCLTALHMRKKTQQQDPQNQKPVSESHRLKKIESKGGREEETSVSDPQSLDTSTAQEVDYFEQLLKDLNIGGLPASPTATESDDSQSFSDYAFSYHEIPDTVVKTGKAWTTRFGTLEDLEKHEPWMSQLLKPYQQIIPKVNPLEHTGKIFMGNYPGDNPHDPTDLGAEKKLPVLLGELGINQIVCLQKEDELPFFTPYQQTAIRIARELSIEPPEFLHFGIRDVSIAKDQDVYDFVLKTLLPAVTAPNKRTYIHCWGGNGRTGTISSIVLACLYGLDAETALKKVNTYHKFRLNPHYNAPETGTQKDQVRRLVPLLLEAEVGASS